MKDARDPIDKDHIPCELIKHGTFEWPRSEARQTLAHLFDKIKGSFAKEDTSGPVDDQNLEHIADDALKTTVTDLLARCVGAMLDRHYLTWSENSENGTTRRAFVYPPTCENTLEDWAERYDLPILRPDGQLSDLATETCIVIPKLEAFFRRDCRQMEPLFDLFAELADHEGKVLVGINSWTWQFLKQFDDAHLLFADVATLPAFDADALAALLERALSDTGDRKPFTSVASGDPILVRDEDGALEDPYLEKLAKRSLGHPWVAVEMFFRGIAEVKDEDASAGVDKTWVDLPDKCTLPINGAEALRFALQALMIHGSRPIKELNSLLPHRVPNGIWIELTRAGFINIVDGVAQCATCSYPDIRSELGAAGFNLDSL